MGFFIRRERVSSLLVCGEHLLAISIRFVPFARDPPQQPPVQIGNDGALSGRRVERIKQAFKEPLYSEEL